MPAGHNPQFIAVPYCVSTRSEKHSTIIVSHFFASLFVLCMLWILSVGLAQIVIGVWDGTEEVIPPMVGDRKWISRANCFLTFYFHCKKGKSDQATLESERIVLKRCLNPPQTVGEGGGTMKKMPQFCEFDALIWRWTCKCRGHAQRISPSTLIVGCTACGGTMPSR